MHKFKSIESFKHAIGNVNRFCHEKSLPLPKVEYIGRVKLHGTNCGIRRTPSGKIQPQSRERIIDIGNDNMGFAIFVEQHKIAVLKLFDHFPVDSDITIYGEWCGSGIQKGVALNDTPKHWVMFFALVDEKYTELPDDLHDNDHLIYNVKQIPAYEVLVDYAYPAPASEILAELTIKVEEECPWAKQMFNVSGIGEGIVWHQKGHPENEWTWFKTKGLKHKGGGKANGGAKIKISNEKMASIQALAEELLPDWRLEQGISQLRQDGIPLLAQSTGTYLQWIAKDILKEEVDTIAASGFTWKETNGAVVRIARDFYLTYIQEHFE